MRTTTYRRLAVAAIVASVAAAVPAVAFAAPGPDPTDLPTVSEMRSWTVEEMSAFMESPAHDAFMNAPGHEALMGSAGHEAFMDSQAHEQLMGSGGCHHAAE